MKLNEIKQTGFYKRPGDETPNFIFEVINNTDKEWLKEDPQCTLLIDEWLYDYTDMDDRRRYETAGNLVSVIYAEDIEVEKMDDKFVVEDTTMMDDKPTYKEKYNNLIEQIKKDLKRYDNFDSNYELIPSDVICDLRDYLRMSNELEKFDQEVSW